MQQQPPTLINPDTLNGLLGRAITDFGGTSLAALVVIGDRLGLYRVLAANGAITASELAARSGTHERYVREWLNAHAASGYVTYLADWGGTSSRPNRRCCSPRRTARPSSSAAFKPRWRLAASWTGLPRPSGPAMASAGTSTTTTCSAAAPASTAWDISITWSRNGSRRSTASMRGSSPAPASPTWAAVWATRRSIMAKAYPNSHFTGFDIHAESIAAAIGHAREAGVTNVSFEMAPRGQLPRQGLWLRHGVRCAARHGRPGRALHAMCGGRSRRKARG